jgi:DNA invertase Pin-like site-specific DNA recombinase
MSALQPGDVVIALRLDRLWRRLADFAVTIETWTDQGVHVHAIDLGAIDLSTAHGFLIAAMNIVVAELESLRAGERIRGAKTVQREDGASTNGQARLGYRLLRGRHVPDLIERRLCRRIVRLRDNGWSWYEISAKLAAERVRTRDGRLWTHQRCFRGYHAAKAGFP